MRDLFDKPGHDKITVTKPQQRATAAEIENALQAHLQRSLDDDTQRLGYVPPITSRHYNAAYHAVSRIFGVKIPKAAAAWWECQPHDNDPLWPVFANRALQEIAKLERGHDIPTQEDRNDALDRAAMWIRYEARRVLELAKTDKAA
jgi:hypothetical protein